MFAYQAAYRIEEEFWVGTVLDFPGCVSGGATLEEARKNLSCALLDLAESHLLDGNTLPRPDAAKHDPDAELEEPIYLVLRAGHKLHVKVSA